MEHSSRKLSAALRTSRRTRWWAFVAGSLALFICLRAFALFRVSIAASFGETTFLAIVGVGAFLALLGPAVVAELLLSRNPFLRCQNCGSLLTGMFAIRFHRTSATCRYCGSSLGVVARSKREILTDACVVVLGFATIFLLSRLIL